MLAGRSVPTESPRRSRDGILPFTQDELSVSEAGDLPQGVDFDVFLAMVVT